MIRQKRLHILIRIPLLVVESFIALLVIYQILLLFCMIVPVNTSGNQCSDYKCYVVSNGVHTDICIPVSSSPEIRALIDVTGFDAPPKEVVYLGIGWGDKGFYLDTPTWADLKVSTALNAMLINSPTAMHVTLVSSEPEESDLVKQINVCEENFGKLKKYILNSFQLSETGAGIEIPNSGYYENDLFYEAKGNYHIFKTCNSWTNSGLKIAGIRTSLRAFNEQGIMRHLD